MTACDYPGCLTEVPPRIGRGRPDIYCPEHKKARKQEQDKAAYERRKARINSEKPETTYEENYFPCCIQWQLGGRPNRTICPQHRQWHLFCKQSSPYRTSIRHNGDSTGHDKEVIISLIESGRGVRVSPDPDSWKPIDRFDKAQDKALREWIDAGMPGAVEMKEIYANMAAARLSHIGQLIPAGAVIVNVGNYSDKQLGHVQMTKTKAYRSFAAAARRQGVLVRKYGVCAGIRTMRDGTYRLTFDVESGWIVTPDD